MRGDLCCANDFIKTVILLGSSRVRILILTVGGWQPIFTKTQSDTTTVSLAPSSSTQITDIGLPLSLLAHFSRFSVMLLASAG